MGSHKLGYPVLTIWFSWFQKLFGLIIFLIIYLLSMMKVASAILETSVLARKPNLQKMSIYSNKFFYNFHLSKSSFICPCRLRAGGLVQDCTRMAKFMTAYACR
jgi:hypothetical protein